MTMQYRSISWKRLLNQHKQEFFTWLDEKKERLLKFNKLADDLERYIMMCLTNGPYYERELSTAYLCEQFANRIPDVYVNCDNPQMYEKYMAALAYAHVHLLERYRRFWDVLVCLIDAAVLPMSDKGLKVLDVGTGPAPALYAVYDLYEALLSFSSEK